MRKERFEPGAFRYAIEDDSRAIDVLVGHDFGKPLASRLKLKLNCPTIRHRGS